jgi:hypothetical protein
MKLVPRPRHTTAILDRRGSPLILSPGGRIRSRHVPYPWDQSCGVSQDARRVSGGDPGLPEVPGQGRIGRVMGSSGPRSTRV